VAGALLLGACASVPDAAQGQVAGCWQFRWDEGARTLGLPWGVVLHDEPLPGDWPLAASPEPMLAETATSPTGREDHPFGYWRLTEADSVEIGHPGGGGFTLTLVLEGDDLVGSGVAVGDAVRPGEPFGPRPSQPVLARRVLCGAS
jgi:hypothetical protein